MKKKYKGKCTTLTFYNKDDYDFDSEYYNHKVQCDSKDLQKELNSSLVYMALADINYQESNKRLLDTLFKALYRVKNENDLKVVEDFIDQVLGKNEDIDYLLKHIQEVVKNNGPDVLELKDTTKEDLIDSIDRKIGR